MYLIFSKIFHIKAGCLIKVGYMEIINNSSGLYSDSEGTDEAKTC